MGIQISVYVINAVYLAGLTVHVEGDCDGRGDLSGTALHQVLSEAGGEVSLPRAAGPRQDQTPVLQQQTNIVLYHRLRDKCLKHHIVHTLLLQTCMGIVEIKMHV